MEYASIMQTLSPRKNPRNGQRKVLEKIITAEKKLNVQLPTGYGKTLTACFAYAFLRHMGKVDRILYITPTKSQHAQFARGAVEDFLDAGIRIKGNNVYDVNFYGDDKALCVHRRNEHEVFAVTIQTLSRSLLRELVNDPNHNWMVVVDEYHHYGIDASWGKEVATLKYKFLLTMSATPFRKSQDSAFGEPDVVVDYRTAVEEGAVKPLLGHSYVYRVEIEDQDTGQVSFYTTSEIESEFGQDMAKLDKKLARQMRWNPKYLSPLITLPIDRMLVESNRVGKPLQAIFFAMCVSHAKLIKEQIEMTYPGLEVDWVGTGPDGRTDEENRKILEMFCPPKGKDGKRHFTLRVLVNCGMAGEGLDSVHVSEVSFMNSANITNSANQSIGRAARWLSDVVGNINFDSCSQYAEEGYVGDAIMDALDFNDPQTCSKCNQIPCVCEPGGPIEPPLIPPEPFLLVGDAQLMEVNSGDPDVAVVVQAINAAGGINHSTINTASDLDDPDIWEIVKKATQKIREGDKEQIEKLNDVAQVENLRSQVNNATSLIVREICKIYKDVHRKDFAGIVKRAINSVKKRVCGPVENNIEVLKKHYYWLGQHQESIRNTKRIAPEIRQKIDALLMES